MAGFEWDEGNINHIAEHNVLPSEAEEASTFKPVALPKKSVNGEERLVQIGQTCGGRILQVVSTPRNGKIRIITAHDIDLSKRKAYALKRDVLYGDSDSKKDSS
jgi:uncharacterized DUF497 family protein